MKELYIEEAVEQLTKLEADALRIRGLLENIVGKKTWCKDCQLPVFAKDGKCPRCGQVLKQ